MIKITGIDRKGTNVELELTTKKIELILISFFMKKFGIDNPRKIKITGLWETKKTNTLGLGEKIIKTNIDTKKEEGKIANILLTGVTEPVVETKPQVEIKNVQGMNSKYTFKQKLELRIQKLVLTSKEYFDSYNEWLESK
tara:strand:+ start:4571 stop:4990 length:420 start_codon:yes stop_codon:yes gene_type:complete